MMIGAYAKYPDNQIYQDTPRLVDLSRCYLDIIYMHHVNICRRMTPLFLECIARIVEVGRGLFSDDNVLLQES